MRFVAVAAQLFFALLRPIQSWDGVYGYKHCIVPQSGLEPLVCFGLKRTRRATLASICSSLFFESVV